jgi:membrane fusion protein, multidrug efflux system
MNETATPGAPAAPATPQARPPGGNRRGVLLIISSVFVLAGIGWLLFWWLVLSRRESTDDAYVSGNLVTISSQVAGTVTAVLADDTERVQLGQELVRLDPTDAKVALDQAAAALGQTVRQIEQQDATAAQRDAEITRSQVALAQAQADLDRRSGLLAVQAIAQEELAHAQASVDLARAALAGAQRDAAAAHAVVGRTPIPQQPTVLQAKSSYEQAWVNARRTSIVAPISGEIAQRSVQLGQRLTAGQALMTVIPLQNLWVDANFKEGQLGALRIGQPAQLRTEIYGGNFVFHGRVIGVSAGTGAAFSLLPPQNASGNWIKVVQRLPVRIALDPTELNEHPLRIGLTTDVAVTTVDRSGPVLAPIAGAQSATTTDIYAGDFAEAARQADALISAAMAQP